MAIHVTPQKLPPNPGRRDSSIKNQVMRGDGEEFADEDDDDCTYCSNNTLYINQNFHDDQNNNNTAVLPGSSTGGNVDGSNTDSYYGGWPKTNQDVSDECCSHTTTSTLPPSHHHYPTGTAMHGHTEPSFQPVDLIHACLVIAFILLNVLLIYCFMSSYHSHRYPCKCF